MGPTIALITDFGIEDSYVGIMKGVMRKICPTADFIDISHSITRQNAREAALTLMNAYRYFPAGTIFLVVVDPGVGSERRPVAVSGDEYFFVAPDNGVLSYTLAELELLQAVSLSKEEYHLEPVSQTFHGRDIFSPAAAHLAAGIALSELGEAIEDLQRLPAPELRLLKDRLLGEVTHIDHFGNVVTSIGELIRAGKNTIRLKPRYGTDESPRYFSEDRVIFEHKSLTLRGVKRSYSEVAIGDALLLIDSNGFLELSMNQDHCASRLGLRVGDRIEIEV